MRPRVRNSWRDLQRFEIVSEDTIIRNPQFNPQSPIPNPQFFTVTQFRIADSSTRSPNHPQEAPPRLDRHQQP